MQVEVLSTLKGKFDGVHGPSLIKAMTYHEPVVAKPERHIVMNNSVSTRFS